MSIVATPRSDTDRRWLQIRLAAACGIWATVGGAIALSAIGTVDADVRRLILVLSIVFPLAAVIAGLLLLRGLVTAPFALLLISAATPTYFFAVVNLAPLVIAAIIFVRRATLRGEGERCGCVDRGTHAEEAGGGYRRR